MMISERTVEANVLIDYFHWIKDDYPKSFVYMPSQREEYIQGYDALTYNTNYPLLFQFKRARQNDPYRYEIFYRQNEMLLNLSRHLPDSIYYVFPLFSEFAELKAITPHFLDHCCLIRIEDLTELKHHQNKYQVKRVPNGIQISIQRTWQNTVRCISFNEITNMVNQRLSFMRGDGGPTRPPDKGGQHVDLKYPRTKTIVSPSEYVSRRREISTELLYESIGYTLFRKGFYLTVIQ